MGIITLHRPFTITQWEISQVLFKHLHCNYVRGIRLTECTNPKISLSINTLLKTTIYHVPIHVVENHHLLCPSHQPISSPWSFLISVMSMPNRDEIIGRLRGDSIHCATLIIYAMVESRMRLICSKHIFVILGGEPLEPSHN